MEEVFSFGSFLCYLDIKREKNTASLRRKAGSLNVPVLLNGALFFFARLFS